jgi:hypothetical protein
MLLAMANIPLCATVKIVSMKPSVAPPQLLGTVVRWTVTATDSSTSNLTFQFNVAAPGSSTFSMVRDFNVGKLSAGVWTAQPFEWTSIAGEGIYTIQVIAKDFTTGDTAAQTANFRLQTRVSNSAVVHATANPLIALFSAPSCAKGSTMRVAFYTGSSSPTYTTWSPCNSSTSMNFYIAGMLPSTTYSLYSQTQTRGTMTNGTTLSFTSGPLPTRLPRGQFFAPFTANIPGTDTANPVLLWAFTKIFVPVATDESGHIMWYYDNGNGSLLTRPLPGGTMLTLQNGPSWGTTNTVQQLLREIDVSGNIIHETNTGIITNQLLAMGVTDATPCEQVPQPPQVGAACLDDFHHDAIRLPNGNTAFLAHVEKLFPPGTQGHQGPNPVDILSEMVIVLNANWQVVWYYDAFEQLDITRTAPLGETCTPGSSDCPTRLFLASAANDWTHANTVDYVASSQNPDSGDLLVSVRNQDRVIKLNYNGGQGSCAPPAQCIGWYMGPPDNLPVPPNSFTINNITNDPWPWFSHQHDVTYANGGANVVDGLPLLTIFDNGNTRLSNGPLGLGSSNCQPNDCHSRGMALVVNESTMTVTPVFLQDLGVYATALGGAELVPSNNNFFFQTGIASGADTYALEYLPNAGTTTGTQVLNVSTPDYSYRAWQMPSLYNPPLL